MANYVQRGESLDFVNSTDATILAGSVLAFGARVAVAGCDIPAGEMGSIHVAGVFEIPTDATITAGAEVYFKDGKILASTTSGAVKAGFAVAASANGAVKVKINA